MTTLSLFGPDTFDDEPEKTPVIAPAPVVPPARSARHGGLTLPVLAFAALVASPAIWQCLVRHELAVHVMLERYVLIALGCLLVSEVALRMMPQQAVPAEDHAAIGPGAGTASGAAGETGDPALALLADEG
jgi:hypothetical protein